MDLMTFHRAILPTVNIVAEDQSRRHNSISRVLRALPLRADMMIARVVEWLVILPTEPLKLS